MRRTLRAGQIYTAHDGSGIYRRITMVDVWGNVYYMTNRGPSHGFCLRKTFIEWVRTRKARRTQKYRRRPL